MTLKKESEGQKEKVKKRRAYIGKRVREEHKKRKAREKETKRVNGKR